MKKLQLTPSYILSLLILLSCGNGSDYSVEIQEVNNNSQLSITEKNIQLLIQT